jgi:hypothetical protein
MNQSQQQQTPEQQQPHEHQQQERTSTPAITVPAGAAGSCSDAIAIDDYHQLNLRAALALNNMGVSLLCKGSFSSALKTFKDSLAVVKIMEQDEDKDEDNATRRSGSRRRLDNNNATTGTSSTVVVQSMVQRASARLATKCIPKKQQSSKKGSPRRSAYAYYHSTVDIVALDDTDIAAIRSAIRYGPSVSMAFPIRCTFLEHHQQEQGQQQRSRSGTCSSSSHSRDDSSSLQHQYYAAMIGYNHGLAHLLAYAPTSAMATSSLSSSSSRKLLSLAFTHLSHAHGLLLRNVVVPAPAPSCTDNTQHEENSIISSGRSSSSIDDDVNNTLDEQNTNHRHADDDIDNDNDDDNTRYFSNLLLLGLVLMSLHTFFRHKTNRQEEAHQVLESLINLEDAIQEHDVMETNNGRAVGGVMMLCSSSSSLTLLCDCVHGASAA